MSLVANELAKIGYFQMNYQKKVVQVIFQTYFSKLMHFQLSWLVVTWRPGAFLFFQILERYHAIVHRTIWRTHHAHLYAHLYMYTYVS